MTRNLMKRLAPKFFLLSLLAGGVAFLTAHSSASAGGYTCEVQRDICVAQCSAFPPIDYACIYDCQQSYESCVSLPD
jgi:hypothetical protein